MYHLLVSIIENNISLARILPSVSLLTLLIYLHLELVSLEHNDAKIQISIPHAFLTTPSESSKIESYKKY